MVLTTVGVLLPSFSRTPTMDGDVLTGERRQLSLDWISLDVGVAVAVVVVVVAGAETTRPSPPSTPSPTSAPVPDVLSDRWPLPGGQSSVGCQTIMSPVVIVLWTFAVRRPPVGVFMVVASASSSTCRPDGIMSVDVSMLPDSSACANGW